MSRDDQTRARLPDKPSGPAEPPGTYYPYEGSLPCIEEPSAQVKPQIAAPRMRLSFGDEGIPLEALSGVTELVGAALTEHGLIDCAAECRVANVGRTLHLIAPGGAVVWSHELPKAVV